MTVTKKIKKIRFATSEQHILTVNPFCLKLISFLHQGLWGKNFVCGSDCEKFQHVDVSASSARQGSVGTKS